jgi:cardiolipin synthase
MHGLPLAKLVADTLTGARCFLAVYIAWVGLALGADGLGRAMVGLVCAWVTDLLDGTLARLKPCPRQTWIGRRDLEVDIAVAGGVLFYLAWSGYVSGLVALAYFLLALAGYALSGNRALGMAMQAPIYLLALATAYRYAFAHFVLAALWIAIVIVVTWPRFPKEVVPDFLRDVAQLLRLRR